MTQTDGITTRTDAFVAHFYVRPEHRDDFARRLDALWQADIEGLQAVTNFIFYGWGRDPNEFVAIASWKDHAVTDATRASAFFQEQVSGLMSLCNRPMRTELYAGMHGTRAIFDRYPPGDSALHPRSGGIGGVFA